MKFQKGQAIVEFALVLPLFVLVLYFVFYAGFAFADYLTMSNVTRSIAHEASVHPQQKYPEIIKKNLADQKLLSDIYVWEPDKNGGNNQYLSVNYDLTTQRVIVKSSATYNATGSTLARVMLVLLNKSAEDSAINIEYTMYSPPDFF